MGTPYKKILPPQHFSVLSTYLLSLLRNCYRLYLSLTQVYRQVGSYHSREHDNVRNVTPAPT